MTTGRINQVTSVRIRGSPTSDSHSEGTIFGEGFRRHANEHAGATPTEYPSAQLVENQPASTAATSRLGLPRPDLPLVTRHTHSRVRRGRRATPRSDDGPGIRLGPTHSEQCITTALLGTTRQNAHSRRNSPHNHCTVSQPPTVSRTGTPKTGAQFQKPNDVR